jgi:phosphatidylserine/phosphatidylglycerophosphate/cardiolipin synthase-like enzyme
MKRRILLISLFTLSLQLFAFVSHALDVLLESGVPAQVYFSPDGGSTDAVIRAIAGAKSEILIQAYSLRSPIIAQALIHARKSGIKVEIIIDKSERQEGLTPPTLMAIAGIPVYLDGKHAIANNRVFIIDNQTVITGSFNFNSASEELNAENLLILKSKALAALYRNNWLNHRKHGEQLH